jgi:four helix bundle protein
MGHFKQLKAWQHARSLTVLSHAAIAKLPPQESQALADRWRRACYGVALNIAEGASRRGTKDFQRHLDIARSSLDEIEGIVDLVMALEYFRPEELARIEAVRDECAKTVFGLIRKLGASPARRGSERRPATAPAAAGH